MHKSKRMPTAFQSDTWKKELMTVLDQKYKTAQEMVDMVFSFSELGFPGNRNFCLSHKNSLNKTVLLLREESQEFQLHGWLNGEVANLS
jgi:hypothetical protein